MHDSRSVGPLVQQVHRREVEIKFRHGCIGQVAGDRVEHVLLARTWTQHGRRHVGKGAEQPVAVLEAGDEQPACQGGANQVRARLQEEVCRRRPAHGRQRIPAEHDKKSVRLIGAAKRVGRHDMELGGGGPGCHCFAQQRFPGRRHIVPVDAWRRRHGRMRCDELQAHALCGELVDRRGVEIAGEEQVRERDRQEPSKLLGVGLRVSDRSGQERCQAPEALECRALCIGEDSLDDRRRSVAPALKLREHRLVGHALTGAVVQVHEPEQAVAGQQRQPDRRLHLVAADERAVDLGGRVPCDKLLPGDGQPDRRPVVMDPDLVGDLALLLVAKVTMELLAHISQRVEQAFLRLADRERGVVLPACLLVKEDGDDVRA